MSDERLVELVREMRAALAARDFDRLAGCLAHEFTQEYPQSRERLRGVDKLRQLLAEHPQPPRGASTLRVTVVGEETVAVEEVASYGEEPWWIVAIFGVAGEKIHSERAYFGRALARAAWRRDWVVPIPETAQRQPEPQPQADDERAAGHDRGADRELAERYFTAQAIGDFAVLDELRRDDFVHDMPQSGERFPNARAYVEAHERYPGGLPTLRPLAISGPRDQWVVTPTTGPLRVSGRGAHWIGEAELVYPNGDRWFEVLFMDFRDGSVAAERSYWAEPFDAPEWRAGLSERY